MKYVKAEAKVVLFDNSDVITTSGWSNWEASGGCDNETFQGGADQWKEYGCPGSLPEYY